MKAFIYTGGTVFADRIAERPAEGDLVVAADAGLRAAEACGVTPDLLIGDFDSLGGEPPHSDRTELIRLPAEKDETDTQAALRIALSRGAAELVLVGGVGGRIDHTLSNLSLLEQLHARHVPAVLTDGKCRVRFLRDSGVILLRDPNFRYFSILPVDPKLRGVSLDGCKYPLKNATILRTNPYAVSNEIAGNCALVEIRHGAAFVIESSD